MADKTKINNEIINLVFNLSRMVRTGIFFDKNNKHLTLYQIQTMLFIAKRKKARMIDIAQNFNITKPTATVLVNSLVNSGSLKRAIGKKDKREVEISLASKGKNLLNKVMKLRSTKINQILSYISDKDKLTLRIILQTVVDKLKENYEN